MLDTHYKTYIHQSRYARWLDDKGRRETWDETVDRYCDFMLDHVEQNTTITPENMEELRRLFNGVSEM